MTVSTEAQTIVYDGDGVTVNFDIPWPFAASTDIRVDYLEADGETETTLILNTDYAVTGSLAAGFKVSFSGLMGAPADGSRVAVMRREPALQTTPFNDSVKFPAARVAAMGDKLARAIQDVKDEQGLFFRLSSVDHGKLGPVPDLSQAVGKFFTFVDDPDNPGNYLVSFSPSVAAVEATAAIASQILTVANISASVVIVGAGSTPANIATVAGAIGNVNTVAGAIANVNTVAGAIGSVNTVAGAIANVNTVAGAIANMNTVATNIAAVGVAATNIALIQAAPTNAQEAKDARDDAQAAAAATVGSAAAAAASASAASASATAADNSADAALSYLASTTAAAGTAVGTVFLPNFVAKSRTTAAQPGSPANLDTYILPASPTGAAWGAWAEGDVVRYFTTGASWTRVVPSEGASAYVQDEKVEVRFENGAWAALSSGFGVSLQTLGATMGESLSQAVYEANDTAIEAFKLTKRISFLEGMIGCWTTKNFRDALKMWASGFAAFVATGQDNARAGAAGLVYKGPATNDAFIWHLESPMGVQPGTVVLTFDPTGAELNVAGNYIEKANSFVEGEYVTYSNGGGTSIGGLTSGSRYYVKDKGVGGANRFKLSATRGGAAIDLTAGATGTAHTLTQADTNLEGTDLRGITIDGGLAKYGYVTGRNGYGNSVDRCFFTGGTDTALAILNGFGVKWGHNYVGRCPNVGLRIGENLFGFLTSERYAFAVEGSFHVAYTGHDTSLNKIVDYTVVRATLNDADGSEDDGPNTAETRRYLVGTAATGTFAGQDNKIAEYDPSGPSWSFVAKSNGAIVYDMTANNALLFNGTTWSVDNTQIEKGAGAIVLTSRQGAGLHFTTVERCAGWGLISGNRANFGPSEVSVGYLERNAGGVLIAYENNSRAPVVNIGFANPGSTHPEQTICIRGQSSVSGATADWLSSATPLADAGPADEAHYLVLNIGHGYNDAGTDGVSLYSDTGKYFVYARDAKIHYGNKVPRNYVDPAQTIVYVNASTGHDAYPGTSAKPLASLTEAFRRRRLNPLIATINMAGSFIGQSVDAGGQRGGTVIVDGGGSATLGQSGNNVDAVLVKGKGCRLKFQNFASIGKVTVSNADVEIVGNITAMSAGYDDNSEPDTPGTSLAHYGLWVEDDANVHLVGNVDADKARGIRVDSSRLRIYGTVTNYDTGFAVVVNDGAQIESNALSGDANALNLIGANAAGGAGFEGFITFKDGSVYSYESQAMQSGDPWTYLKVASDQASTSTSNANITGLNFVPAINTQYEFEAVLILQSAAVTTGAKVTITWPNGTIDEGVAVIEHPNGSTSAFLTLLGNKGASITTAGTDFPAADTSYLCRIRGTFKQGASVSASLRPGIATEVGGSAVTVKAGSFLKYRAI